MAVWLQAVAEAQSDATDRRMLCAPCSLCLRLGAEVGVGVVGRAQLLVALLGKDANDSTRQQTLGAQTLKPATACLNPKDPLRPH